jgi:hypothetical protein
MTEDKHDWETIVARIPIVEFLLPHDFAALRAELRQTHRLEILEARGVPEQIGRVP